MAKSRIRQWVDEYANRADDITKALIQGRPAEIAKEIEMRYNNFKCWNQIDYQNKQRIVKEILEELNDNESY